MKKLWLHRRGTIFFIPIIKGVYLQFRFICANIYWDCLI